MSRQYKTGLLVSLTITFVIVLFKEWETLGQFNEIFFGNYYDALKNYYTFLYHIKWDEAYFTFEGMNYPYNEHVLFTDNQPIISNTLKVFHDIGIPVENFALGLFNALLYISLLFATFFNYKCLQHLKVQPWMAALVAVGLTFLSPQIDRMNGHFALSYSFIIPLMLYQALLFIEKPLLKRSVYIGLITVCVAFLHAYYLGFALLIFGCLFLTNLYFRQMSFAKSCLHFVIQAVASLLVVEGIMHFTDHVIDRPTYPWSPFLYNFLLHGVFFPVGKPIGEWIDTNFGMPDVLWEAQTYVGAFASLFFLLGILLLPFFLIFRKIRKHHPFIFTRPSKGFLLLSAVVALSVPAFYTLFGRVEEIYLNMGPVRQFRAITRFNWIFFSAINFYAFAWLSQWFTKRKSPWKWALPILVILLLANDAYQHSKTSFENHKLPLMTEGSEAQKQMQLLLEDYDALIPIPYFHIGSESFAYRPGGDEQFKNAMSVSYAAGVPMTGVMLSRTSLNQTLNSLAYSIFPMNEPAFIDQLSGKKTALLLLDSVELSAQEQLLASAGGKILFENADFTLVDFDLDRYKELYAKSDLQYAYAHDVLSKNPVFFDYEEDTNMAYLGKGSLAIPAMAPREVETIELPDTFSTHIKLGFWAYIYEQTKAIEAIDCIAFNEEGQELKSELISIRGNLKVIDGHWGYVEQSFEIPQDARMLKLIFRENNLYPSITYIDGLNVSFGMP